MRIHFVCDGNVFRSRLAEAYLNSKKTHLKASSSGIKADVNFDGPICWYTQRILTNSKIIPFTKPAWTKTSREILNLADLVIFFDKNCYQGCQKNFGFESDQYEVWDIPDVNDLRNFSGEQTFEQDVELIKATEKTFRQIKKKVGQLITKL